MNRMDDSGITVHLSEFTFIHVIASNGEYNEIEIDGFSSIDDDI